MLSEMDTDHEFVFPMSIYVRQGLFQDFAQEGANALWQIFEEGANPNHKEGQPHIKYRESQLPGGGGKSIPRGGESTPLPPLK